MECGTTSTVEVCQTQPYSVGVYLLQSTRVLRSTPTENNMYSVCIIPPPGDVSAYSGLMPDH